MRVFVAGATGAVGRALVPRMVARGHEVVASSRSADKSKAVEAIGATPFVFDLLDGLAVREAIALVKPDVIVHEATALAGESDLRHFDRWFATTNRLRVDGTDHLLAAAQQAGVRRMVAQSYTGWNNDRTGGPIKTEDDPLDRQPLPAQRRSMAAIGYLERSVLGGSVEGVVLRYGNLYGPGASDGLVELVRKRRFPVIGDGGGVWSWIHVDDAATATIAALEEAGPGIYNVVDDDPAPVSEWLPYLADVVKAKPPMRVPRWVGRLAAGAPATRWMTEGRGASNAKLKRHTTWQPQWQSWRDGFRRGLTAPGSPAG